MSRLRRALAELRALRRLPRGERALLAQAAVLLPAVDAMQKLLPFQRWRRLLTRARVRNAPGTSPRSVADAVECARHWVPGAYRCLPTAYTTHILLARHGHPSQIHVGVSHDRDGKVEAHAWVVCEGTIIVGDLPDLSRFVPLPPLER